MTTDKPTGDITGLPVLDLTTLRAPEDLAGISSIRGVAQILVPESLVPTLNAIPQSGVASVVPIPDGVRTKLHTGVVTMGGDGLGAEGVEDEALVVTGTLILTSPVAKVSYRQVVVTGVVLAPEGSEAALTAGLTRLTGAVDYFPYVDGQRIDVRSGQGRISGDVFANRGGSPDDLLLLAGQFVVSDQVTEVGYQRVVVAGQCIAPRQAESVLSSRLIVHGPLIWYDGQPRVFTGKDHFTRDLFELLEDPVTLVLIGSFTFGQDVTVDVLRKAVTEIVLLGRIEVPRHLLGLVQLLTLEKQGSIAVAEDAGDRP